MNPRDFEVAIARQLQAEGYATEVTGSPGDWGVDIIALRGAERLAVQVKMYGGTTRPVNRRMVFELFGAAAYFDCSGSVIATDGRIMADAAAAAEKLGMRILRPGPSPDAAVLAPVDARQLSGSPPPTASRSGLDFETIWAGSIVPLVGRTLTRADLSSNVVVQVDWAGVTRITSNGRRQHIPIEVFRWAIDRVLRTGRVTRAEINEQYVGRASSGIVLILSQVPAFRLSGTSILLRPDPKPHR